MKIHVISIAAFWHWFHRSFDSREFTNTTQPWQNKHEHRNDEQPEQARQLSSTPTQETGTMNSNSMNANINRADDDRDKDRYAWNSETSGRRNLTDRAR